jgi:hypothetical protein
LPSYVKWNEACRKKWGIKNGAAKELRENPAGRPGARAEGLSPAEDSRIRTYRRAPHPPGEVFGVEANPNSSLAEDEDFVHSAADAGVGYDSLIQEILNAAFA